MIFGSAPKEKTPENVSQIGFEPEEQPTPFLGKLLLFILSVLLIFFGWRGLEDLGDIPKKPQELSNCFVNPGSRYLGRGEIKKRGTVDYGRPDNFPTYYFKNTCNFSSYEIQAGVPEKFQIAKEAYAKVDIAQQSVTNIQSQINKYQSQYSPSLLERIADEQTLEGTPAAIRSQIGNQRQQLQTTQSQLSQAQSSFKNTLPPLLSAYKAAGDSYEKDWARYKFWVFLLEILFVAPFFAASIWFYRRLHAKASPHTVIAIPIVAVSSILLARVILVYFWNLFLADLAELLLLVISQLAIFRSLVYYLGMILAVVIFGGAVYKLQKQIFAPQRVRIRRLRSKKCPYCEFSLDLTKNFCPGCGKQLMMHCKSCNQERFVDMRYCPSCGKP